MELSGVGPVGAARVLADVGDVARFADRNRFASWTGTAPLDASSGEQIRHRLSRAGNRRMNHVLHVAAIVQLRHDTPGRAYYRRKLAAGKTPTGSDPLPEATAVRRRLPPARHRRRSRRQQTGEGAGPVGHCGATLQSSAADLARTVDTSDQPLPGPAATDATTENPHPEDHEPGQPLPSPRLTQRGAMVGRSPHSGV